MLLEGYSLVYAGGKAWMGRLCDGSTALQPAYEAYVKFMMDGRTGQFGISRECMPIAGSTTIRRVNLPLEGCVYFRCEDMSGRECEAWSAAMSQADEIIKAVRTAETGIITAQADPPQIILAK